MAERGFETLDCYQLAVQALNGLIRYTYRQRQGQQEYGDRALHEPEIEHSIQLTPESPNPGSTNSESTNDGG